MNPTTDHKAIRRWAESRGAVPAVLTGPSDGVPGVLKFIIPGAHYENRNLEAVSWEDFFAKFDLLGLTFAYQEMSSQNEILQREPPRIDYRNWH
jgi:hypothetical protein